MRVRRASPDPIAAIREACLLIEDAAQAETKDAKSYETMKGIVMGIRRSQRASNTGFIKPTTRYPAQPRWRRPGNIPSASTFESSPHGVAQSWRVANRTRVWSWQPTGDCANPILRAFKKVDHNYLHNLVSQYDKRGNIEG